MLIGPGNHGSYLTNMDYYNEEYGWSDIKTFAEDVSEGDIVVLKRPKGQKWEVIAAGYVQGNYDYLDLFDDVEGWDLQHCRHVNWRKPQREMLITGLTRGTFKRVHKLSAQRELKKVVVNGISVSSEPTSKPPKELTDEDLIGYLINYGLRIKDAEDFTSTIHRIRRLIRWYYKYGKDILEHETRSFLILPLLLTLGWTEQQLKIEWKKLDIAFFEEPYSKENCDPDACIIILESKRLREGFVFAETQVIQYATDYPNCHRIIVSDGCRYKLFEQENEKWEYSAYLNILNPKQKHSYAPNVGGAQDVFLGLINR